jgi:hypothetical protein
MSQRIRVYNPRRDKITHSVLRKTIGPLMLILPSAHRARLATFAELLDQDRASMEELLLVLHDVFTGGMATMMDAIASCAREPARLPMKHQRLFLKKATTIVAFALGAMRFMDAAAADSKASDLAHLAMAVRAARNRVMDQAQNVVAALSEDFERALEVLPAAEQVELCKGVIQGELDSALLGIETYVECNKDYRNDNKKEDVPKLFFTLASISNLTEAYYEGWTYHTLIYVMNPMIATRNLIKKAPISVRLDWDVVRSKSQERARVAQLWTKLQEMMAKRRVTWEDLLAMSPRMPTSRVLHCLRLCNLRKLEELVERTALRVCREFGARMLVEHRRNALDLRRRTHAYLNACLSGQPLQPGTGPHEAKDIVTLGICYKYIKAHPDGDANCYWRQYTGENIPLELSANAIKQLLKDLTPPPPSTLKSPRSHSRPEECAGEDKVDDGVQSDEEAPQTCSAEDSIKAMIMAPSEGEDPEDAGCCKVCMMPLQPDIDGKVAYLTCNLSSMLGPFHVLCTRCVQDGGLAKGRCPFCRQEATPVMSAAEFVQLLPQLNVHIVSSC